MQKSEVDRMLCYARFSVLLTKIRSLIPVTPKRKEPVGNPALVGAIYRLLIVSKKPVAP